MYLPKHEYCKYDFLWGPRKLKVKNCLVLALKPSWRGHAFIRNIKGPVVKRVKNSCFMGQSRNSFSYVLCYDLAPLNKARLISHCSLSVYGPFILIYMQSLKMLCYSMSLPLQMLFLSDIPSPTVLSWQTHIHSTSPASLTLWSLSLLPQELLITPPLCQYGTLYILI